MTPTGTEARVCDLIAKRQQLGIKKYGTAVANNPLTHRQWLQHALEEALDMAVYLQRSIEEIDGPVIEPKRVYIAGPMSGLPDMNYPAFNALAAKLRAQGLHVENPAENPVCDSWVAYMRLALRQMCTCDAVYLLPGWEASKGACIENDLANALWMQVIEVMP